MNAGRRWASNTVDHVALRILNGEGDDRIFLSILLFDFLPAGIDVVAPLRFYLCFLLVSDLFARLERVTQIVSEDGAKGRIGRGVESVTLTPLFSPQHTGRNVEKTFSYRKDDQFVFL